MCQRAQIRGIIEQIRDFSRDFYDDNKGRVVSIVLEGSLGREENQLCDKVNDVDICIVTRFYYDLLVKNKFVRFLKSKIREVEIDAGVYPVSRLKSGLDRSHFLYDLKYNSKILAGLDIRSLIPEFSINDLYPFEGFLLILNRSIDLFRAVEDFTSEGMLINPEFFRIAASRIRRACIDACLIFNKRYHPDYNLRAEIFRSLYGRLPEVKTFDDARSLLICHLNEGLKIIGTESYKSLLRQLASRYEYPTDFRFFTFVKTRKTPALFRNPIYDVYEAVLQFLVHGSFHGKSFKEFRREMLRTFRNSPKPCLLKSRVLR